MSIVSRLNIFLLMMIAFFVTAFISINSYEIIFRKDLPYANAVQTFQSPALISELGNTEKQTFKDEQEAIIKSHRPRALRFPGTKQKLELLPAVKGNNNTWLEISNKGHFIFLDENPVSGIGNSIIYVSRNWRTIDNPDMIREEDTFLLETEQYTNLYKIVEKNVQHPGASYLVDELEFPYLLLIIEDTTHNINYFVKAVFMHQERNT